jgi:hypothetical protein
MPLNRRGCIDDFEFIAVFQHGDAAAWYDSDNREPCAFGFPAFAAPAGMVVRDIALDADLDRPVLALADKRSTGEAAGAFADSIIN